MLKAVLNAISILTGLSDSQSSSKKPSSLAAVLSRRLETAQQAVPNVMDLRTQEGLSLDDLKLETAETAVRLLCVLREKFQPNEKRDKAPLIGSRDAKAISTCAALTINWGLSRHINPSILSAGGNSSSQENAFIQDFDQLEHFTRQLYFSSGLEVSGMDELKERILPVVLHAVLAALLQMQFGNQSEWATQSLTNALDNLSPFMAISTLLMFAQHAKSKGKDAPIWLHPASMNLLCRRLLQSGGVLAYFKVFLANSDTEPDDMTLRAVSAILLTPPQEEAEIYYTSIFRQIFEILTTPKMLDGYLRACSFVFSHALMSPSSLLTSVALFPAQNAFVIENSPNFNSSAASEAVDEVVRPSVHLRNGLHLLRALLEQLQPNDKVASLLLLPICPTLLSLYFYCFPSDPAWSETGIFSIEKDFKALVRECTIAALEYVPEAKLSQYLQSSVDCLVLVNAQRPFPATAYWTSSGDGGVCMKISREETPDQSAAAADVEGLVALLQAAVSTAALSTILTRWIGDIEMLDAKGSEEEAVLMQFRSQLVLSALEKWGAEVLATVDQKLAFVAFTLRETKSDSKKSIFNIADAETDEAVEDDTMPDFNLFATMSGQLSAMGISLLLAILEGESNLSQQSHPILRIVQTRLEALDVSNDERLRDLRKEALDTLSFKAIRLKASPSKKTNPQRDLFNEALQNLEDPIMPVKSQGLAQLRSLVVQENLKASDATLFQEIVELFITFVDNSDSFLYLSAIQGLCEAASTSKPDDRQLVVDRIVKIYSKPAKGILSQFDLDSRLRLGEALLLVIQRLDEALPLILDTVVPRLLSSLRDSSFPTIQRASSITILSECMRSSALAMLPYASDLLEACLDIVSLKIVTRNGRKYVEEAEMLDAEDLATLQGKTAKRIEETPDALTLDTQHPTLRRSALIFIFDFVKECGSMPASVAAAYRNILDAAMVQQIRRVLGYAAEYDKDNIVRGHASETLSALDDLLGVFQSIEGAFQQYS